MKRTHVLLAIILIAGLLIYALLSLGGGSNPATSAQHAVAAQGYTNVQYVGVLPTGENMTTLKDFLASIGISTHVELARADISWITEQIRDSDAKWNAIEAREKFLAAHPEINPNEIMPQDGEFASVNDYNAKYVR